MHILCVVWTFPLQIKTTDKSNVVDKEVVCLVMGFLYRHNIGAKYLLP